MNLKTLDPKTFATEIIKLVQDNLAYAARACGFIAPEPRDVRRSSVSTSLGCAIVETTLYAQGKRNSSVEVADAITDVANMLWVVPEGEHRKTLDGIMRLAAKKIGTNPLETETRVEEPN